MKIQIVPVFFDHFVKVPKADHLDPELNISVRLNLKNLTKVKRSILFDALLENRSKINEK